jgi:SAM-dependent methyltransferase
MPVRIPQHETRTYERIREHYCIEKELAARLRAAPKEERRDLYTTVYDELFKRVPDHPQLTLKASASSRDEEVAARIKLLRNYLRPDLTYLEVGCGDCALATAVARQVRKVYAVDVSNEIAAGIELPENLELVISDGCTIPVPEASVDLAYSDQLMEHLHVDDAIDQLANIYRALAPDGVYVCITPNRLTGPHDVSRYFDEVATGFHLREYTVGELTEIFSRVGFRKFKILAGGGDVHLTVLPALVRTIEQFLGVLPATFGRTLARGLPLRLILGAKLVARKIEPVSWKKVSRGLTRINADLKRAKEYHQPIALLPSDPRLSAKIRGPKYDFS